MRTIALINQKGGCGKTTSSINLAACLAHLGQRTLLVDMDPQGHCAVGLAVPDQQIEKSVYDILRAPGATVTLKDITWQIASNFVYLAGFDYGVSSTANGVAWDSRAAVDQWRMRHGSGFERLRFLHY